MGYRWDDLTVVIPTLNEAEGIGIVIEELVSSGIRPEQILVVDGGSTDSTREIAESMGVRVVAQEVARGKAGAVMTALKHVDTPYMVVIDGDATYPGSRVGDLYGKLKSEGLDEVIGYRMPSPGSQPLVFRAGNWVLTRWFNLLFGTRLRDVLSGMYALRLSAMRDALLEMPGFSVECEIAAHIASTSGRIGEVPVEYRRRRGRKKLGVLHGFKIALDVLRLSWRYNPTFLVFMTGALLLVPGITLGVYYIVNLVVYGIKYYFKGLVGVILTVAGLQSLSMALLALYFKRMEFRLRRLMEEHLRAGKG